jgi:MFS family permease
MMALTVYFLVQSAVSPFIGRLVDRYGGGKLIAVGAVVAGLGFVMLSFTSALWYFYVGYAVYGIGNIVTSHVPTTAIVSNWFKKRRGVAIGTMGIGIGLGGLVLAPLVGGYLIPHLEWRSTYIAMAIINSVIVIPLALFVIKTRPSDMDLLPDGEVNQSAEKIHEMSTLTSGRSNLKIALSSSAFWLITFAFLTSSFSHVGIIQNQTSYLDDTGFSMAIAATALGTIGFGSAVGKLAFGWLSDRIPPKYACIMGFGTLFVAIYILMNINRESPAAMIWIYSIVMGFGLGSWLPTMSVITSSTFGLASYGVIWGLITGIHGLGTAFGPMVVGYIYDTWGSYQRAFVLALSLLVMASIAIFMIRRPRPLK